PPIFGVKGVCGEDSVGEPRERIELAWFDARRPLVETFQSIGQSNEVRAGAGSEQIAFEFRCFHCLQTSFDSMRGIAAHLARIPTSRALPWVRSRTGHGRS